MRVVTLAFLTILASAGVAVSQTDLTGSEWLAEDIMGRGVIARVQSTLQPLPEGRVAGSGGCNRFMGEGAFSAGKVQIGLLASTQMACAPALMDQEARYLKALAASRRYDIGPDGLMRFYDDSGALTIRFSRIK